MNSLTTCSDKGHAFAGRTTAILFVTSCFALSFAFQSCGPSREDIEYREKQAALADTVSSYIPGLSADTINGITHHFVRNARLKCRMSNVLQATKQIEDLVSGCGGYSSNSDLSSEVRGHNSVRCAKDSTLEQTFYFTSSSMTLRVPNRQLDTVLRQITDIAVFVDFRTLRSDDVKMKLFANALAESRLKHYNAHLEKNVAAAKDHQKTDHLIATEDKLLEKQAKADETRIESYEMADQVNYSTVVLELYETQKVLSEKSPIPETVVPYEPSFGEKFGAAFLNGFQLLKRFILFLTESWSVLLILAIVFVFARKGLRYIDRPGAPQQ